MSIHLRWQQKWQCKPLLHGCHKIHIRPRVQHAPTSKHHIHSPSSHPLNSNAGTFHLQDQPSQDSLQQRAHIGPYVQFMAQRELISNKIEKFNDKPESYLVWKGSFENKIKVVRIFASEKLSLLAEYTTGNAKTLVQKQRNAFITNSEASVEEVWKILDAMDHLLCSQRSTLTSLLTSQNSVTRKTENSRSQDTCCWNSIVPRNTVDCKVSESSMSPLI